MRAEGEVLCGILLLDKPRGLSSNAALQRVRGLLGRPKAGHCGSLDPLATGMLPICIGEATKLAGALLAGAKTYTVEMKLGERSDSGDADGRIVERCPVPSLTEASVGAALRQLLGRQLQIPPMYSALKRDGQPLYKLARRGLSVERAPREVEIRALQLLGMDATTLRLRVTCSKGTYVRSLVEDLGVRLGSCAHVTALRREFVEPFVDDPMVTLEQLAARDGPPPLLAAERAVGHLPRLALSPDEARVIGQGQTIIKGDAPAGELRLYDAAGRLLGLGRGAADGGVRPVRLFAQPAARARN